MYCLSSIRIITDDADSAYLALLVLLCTPGIVFRGAPSPPHSHSSLPRRPHSHRGQELLIHKGSTLSSTEVREPMPPCGNRAWKGGPSDSSRHSGLAAEARSPILVWSCCDFTPVFFWLSTTCPSLVAPPLAWSEGIKVCDMGPVVWERLGSCFGYASVQSHLRMGPPVGCDRDVTQYCERISWWPTRASRLLTWCVDMNRVRRSWTPWRLCLCLLPVLLHHALPATSLLSRCIPDADISFAEHHIIHIYISIYVSWWTRRVCIYEMTSYTGFHIKFW